MNKISLIYRILTPVVVALVLGMGFLAFQAYTTSSTALDKAVSAHLQDVTQGLTRQVQLWTSNLKFSIEQEGTREIHSVVLNSTYANTLAKRKASISLADLVNRSSYILRLGLLNKEGLTVAHSNTEKVGKLNLGERDYFKQAIQGQTVISPILVSKVSNKPLFVVAAPVKTGDVVEGVLYAAIDLELFSKNFVQPVKIGQQGYAYVVDSNGKVAAHPDPNAVMKVDLSQFDWGKSMLQQRNGVMHYAYKDDEKIAAFSTDPASGWLIAAGSTVADFNAAASQLRNTILLVAMGIIGVIGFVLVFTLRPVINAVRRGAQLAETIQQGDLSQRLELDRTDEVGQLSQALNRMADGLEERSRLAEAIADGDLVQEVALASEKDTLGIALQKMVVNLNDILSQIRAAAEQIDTGSAQVAGSAQTLSAGATEQASSLEEITSTITEIATQTRTNAEHAQGATRLGATAQEAADRGTEQMDALMKAMEEIKNAGQDISRIIKTIDEIAFQTNLLALNAAVEAARAGQHGKGFAVVAEEVRNLAARSAKAAQETSELIEKSVDRGEAGVAIAETTSSALSDVVQSIAKTNTLIRDIATASDEQAEGISQVNEGLNQVSLVTQQNTATSEESAAASEELAGQAGYLGELLQQFHLKSGHCATIEPPQPHAHVPEQAAPALIAFER